MPETKWLNKAGAAPNKQFGVSINAPNVTTVQFLNHVADGLNQMNNGSLWKLGKRMMTPDPTTGIRFTIPHSPASVAPAGGAGVYIEIPDDAPPQSEARLFAATAVYSTQEHQGRISLDAAAQRHINGKHIGWTMAFSDHPGDAMAFRGPWKDWVAETVVAYTLLHTGDFLIQALGYAVPATDPVQRWTWLHGSWMTGAHVTYRGWEIALG